MRAPATAALALLLLAAPGASRAGAQADPAATPARDTARIDPFQDLARRYGHLAVSSHAHGTMVGVALRLPAGSGADPEGAEGTAHLLARVRERQAAAALDPARAVLSARVGRDATVYTLLATPEAWREALARTHELVFDSPVPPELVGEERSRILEALRFGAGSPVRSFDLEAASLLVESGSPWASPVRGTVASVPSLDASSLAAWQQQHVRPGATAVAVTGPVEARPEPVTPPTSGVAPDAAMAGARPDSAAPPVAAADSSAPVATAAPVQVPWRVGDRVALVQEVTSAWISVAYPAPDTLSRTALELLAHLVEEELDPVPPDPDRYSVEVAVEETPGGPVLVVQASVLAEALGRWEARVLTTVDRLAASAMADEFFRWKRRRFRTRRLLAEAAPEEEAARMTGDLALLGRARNLDREIWGLGSGDLLAAARALGEPRILLLGPDLGQDGTESGRGGAPAR